MANPILILGESGSGKSTLVKTLDPTNTILFNTDSKALPYRGWKSQYSKIDESGQGNMINGIRSYDTLRMLLTDISDNAPEITSIVIDDHQFMMARYLLDRKDERGYDKYTNLAAEVIDTIDHIKGLREDLVVFIMNHTDYDMSDGSIVGIKAKVSGKLIESQFTFEGLFTTVMLMEKVSEGNSVAHKLRVRGGKHDRIKTGEMYTETYIDPDLGQFLKDLRSFEYEEA